MSTDEQAIRNLVEQWHRATAAGDVDTVLRLMAEDVVFLMAGKPPMKGRSTFEQGLRGLLTSHRVDSRGRSPGSRGLGRSGVLLDSAHSWHDAAFRRRHESAVGQRVVHFPEANERLVGVSARREPLATGIVTPNRVAGGV